MPRRAQTAGLRLMEGRGRGRDSGGRKVVPPPPFQRLPPEPPAVLKGAALAEWRRVLPELMRLELTKPLDAAALASYCLTWARLVEAQGLLAAEGLTRETSGGLGRHPAVGIVEAATRELRSWCMEFGFTPAYEGKVAREVAAPAMDANPFAPGG